MFQADQAREMSNQHTNCPWPHGGVHPFYGLLGLSGSTSNPHVIRLLELIDPHMAAYLWKQMHLRSPGRRSY